MYLEYKTNIITTDINLLKEAADRISSQLKVSDEAGWILSNMSSCVSYNNRLVHTLIFQREAT